LERFNFGTRKHIEVGFKNVMFLCFYVLLDLASINFLLARSGRKTDGHIINIRMFIKFFMFFFAYRQGLSPESGFTLVGILFLHLNFARD
jgi:hypothetical protein